MLDLTGSSRTGHAAAMREGRRRPSLVGHILRVCHRHAAAMREGRRRPSLEAFFAGRADFKEAAMREGRRRPSLLRGCLDRRVLRAGRNEGGAPAPLVDIRLKST